MFRSNIDFFAVLAIALGFAALSRVQEIPDAGILNAIRIEAPAGLADCPVLGAVLSQLEAHINAHLPVNLDR